MAASQSGKKNIAVFAGGNSGEHSISIKSASLIIAHIDREKYEPYLVVVEGDEWKCRQPDGDCRVDRNDMSIGSGNSKITFDAVFNIIHGTPGEDGMLQGYLDMIGMPYTSSGRLTSALTFNKYFCSRFVSTAQCVNIADAVMIRRGAAYNPAEILAVTGVPCFVKPNNGGSSVGMSKVNRPDDLEMAVMKAFEQDDEVLVEAYVKGTEVTCGVFGMDGNLVVLPLTEIVSKTEYFDYEAKYLGKSEEITPARIQPADELEVKRISANLYKHLGCKGVVRFDYILSDHGPYFLEVNTVPGMSGESIIPQQLGKHGLSLTGFITCLVEEALML